MAITLNLMVGIYFILFENDILQSLFHSVTPFLLLCIIDGIIIILLVMRVLKNNDSKTSLKPQTEERGFIFMDLNHSTAIAETLKHQRYSNFLKDTFNILGQVIENVDGLEVYQYVGDEAVLSWELSNASINRTILRILPTFQNKIIKSSKYFRDKYGFIPNFKCAIHGGGVTRTFLGKNHQQSVFHGDVLNTTSRILGLCHRYKTCVLVSESVYPKVEEGTFSGSFEKLGAVNIKGKTHGISLYKMNCAPFYQYSKITKSKFSLP